MNFSGVQKKKIKKVIDLTMKTLASDQFQINEIVGKLGENPLKEDLINSSNGILLKVSKEFGAFQIWVYVMKRGKDFKAEDLDRTALFIESIRRDRLVQTGFTSGIPSPDEIESPGLIRRQRRKPGPDLRPQ
jgi:hypothetical protein